MEVQQDSDNEEEPPKWFEKFFIRLQNQQTEQLASLIKNNGTPTNESKVPPAKRQKTQGGAPLPHHSATPPPRVIYDSDDEFDARFGHLIGDNINNDASDSDHTELPDDSRSNPLKPREQEGLDSVQSDGDESVDEALVEVLDKVPNWEPYSQLKKFITKTIDHPMPEELLKNISEEFVPPADMQEFFIPPKMPSRLYNTISRMISKNAIKSEKAMFNAQKELFIISKPPIAALAELKPLGEQVKLAREKLSISIQGLFSVSIKISRARRENVRFLFKYSLAEVLYTYDPNHHSLFGGTSFSASIESAAKEAKLDLAWAKPPPKPKQSSIPFRNYNQQGFQNRGSGKSSNRRPYHTYQNQKPKYKKNYNKNPKGSSSQGKQ